MKPMDVIAPGEVSHKRPHAGDPGLERESLGLVKDGPPDHPTAGRSKRAFDIKGQGLLLSKVFPGKVIVKFQGHWVLGDEKDYASMRN